jgi:hypothetical protein
MAGDTTEPAPDPVSGLPSVSLGHPVTSDEVADALDDDTDTTISPTAAEAVNDDPSTQDAAAAGRRALGALDDEW